MILPLAYYGNKILRMKCSPIESITEELRSLAYDMIETMDKSHGIGLSAPQVGKSIRLFVLRNYIETPDGELGFSEPMVYINPKLSSPTEETWITDEGCLSIPGIRGEVERPIGITVEAMDLDGKRFVETLEGHNARVRMHENDHLNGVLYIDRMETRLRKRINSHLLQIEKKYNLAK